MTKAQEKAKTILIILDKVDDPEIKNDLIKLFTIPYLEHTKEKPAGKGEEIIEKILEFLRAVADGKIAIDDKEEFGSGIPPLEELIRDFEEARKKGSIEESQVRKALIKAVVAQKKEEQIVRLLKEAGISQVDEAQKDILEVLEKDKQTTNIPEAIKQAAQRYEIPQDKAEVLVRALVSLSPREGSFLETPRYTRIPIAGKTDGSPALRESLLIRISYRKPSILNLVAQELSKIPKELPGAVFETQREIVPVLVNYGVGPEKLRSAIEDFKLQNPDLAENHPVILSLKETLKALADYGRQYPRVDELIKTYQNEIGVDLSFIGESEKEMQGTNSRVFLRVVIRPDKAGVPKLFIVPPTKQVLVPKNVLSRFLVSFKKLFTIPVSLLARMREYLGEALILAALFLPLPLPVRIVMAGGGFWLGWKQIKGFFGNFVPQILSSIKRVELLKFFSKTVGDILYTIFTKPSLAWLRTALAAGFGAASLLLPISIPLRILFLGIGGMFGTVQMGAAGSSFLLRGLGAVGRAGTRLSYALAALPGIPVALIIGAILLAVLLPGFLAYQSAQTQALFLPEGGVADRQSQYIGVSKTTTQTDFENTNIPNAIPFKITITAPQGKLTNVSISDQTTASGKDISETIGTQSWKVAQIADSWTTDYSLNISSELKNKIKDSILINIVTVTADVEGVSGTQTSSSSLAIQVGTPPDECPSGWPIANGWVNQGPDGPATHQGDEAIDIHGNVGDPVLATLKGTAYPFVDKYGGHDVELFGTCSGRTIRVLFVHLNGWSVPAEGRFVRRGEQLGIRGCTGECHSPHLHYQFKDGFKMAPPFIPVAVPRGCVGNSEFNKTVNPCNVRINYPAAELRGIPSDEFVLGHSFSKQASRYSGRKIK